MTAPWTPDAWHAAGLRWIAGLLLALAARLEKRQLKALDDDRFDSDAYLADLRNRIYLRYY